MSSPIRACTATRSTARYRAASPTAASDFQVDLRIHRRGVLRGSGRGAPSAHHSFSAEFDEKNCGEFTGTLTGVDWQNPHPYFFVESKNAGGVAAKLTFQTSSIANMTRGGTPRAYFIMNMGKTVTVRACASLNGTDNRYAASWVRLPNEPLHRTGQDVEKIFGSNN